MFINGTVIIAVTVSNIVFGAIGYTLAKAEENGRKKAEKEKLYFNNKG